MTTNDYDDDDGDNGDHDHDHHHNDDHDDGIVVGKLMQIVVTVTNDTCCQCLIHFYEFRAAVR